MRSGALRGKAGSTGNAASRWRVATLGPSGQPPSRCAGRPSLPNRTCVAQTLLSPLEKGCQRHGRLPQGSLGSASLHAPHNLAPATGAQASCSVPPIRRASAHHVAVRRSCDEQRQLPSWPAASPGGAGVDAAAHALDQPPRQRAVFVRSSIRRDLGQSRLVSHQRKTHENSRIGLDVPQAFQPSLKCGAERTRRFATSQCRPDRGARALTQTKRLDEPRRISKPSVALPEKAEQRQRLKSPSS